MSIFDLHRTASIWGPNAAKFDPNNFLPDNVAERHSHSFVPFGFGSRNCVGKTFRFFFVFVENISDNERSNFVEQVYDTLISLYD